MKPKIIFLAGPTASGKTDTACALARKIKAEIISCDSMQIYKGMDIITSKPPLSLRKKVRHHLVDLVNVSAEFDASQYRRQALKLIEDIIKRGKTPLFAGGTGLYMSVVVDGIFKEEARDKKERIRLEKLAGKYGNGYLYSRLKRIDPQACLKIHPNDRRRIIRALEAYHLSGKPISELQKQREGLGESYDVRMFCLDLKREDLYERINRRVEKMFRQGIVKEAKGLFRRKPGRTASLAIGMRELKGYFSKEYGLEEAKELIKRNTRHYAKRQLTWFRKDKRIDWIKISANEKPERTAQRIWKKLS